MAAGCSALAASASSVRTMASGRAQLVYGIAGEMAQGVERRFQAHHEGVDRFHEPFDLARHGLVDRMQIIRAALGDRIAQPIERGAAKG